MLGRSPKGLPLEDVEEMEIGALTRDTLDKGFATRLNVQVAAYKSYLEEQTDAKKRLEQLHRRRSLKEWN